MRKTLVTMGVAVAAVACQAGIKYWDNPAYRAFDVDCYATNAWWNYDGIRNVGATADHDNAATTWKNVGTGGSTFDLNQKVSIGSGPDGSWTSDGYMFNGGTRWKSSAKVTFPSDWTVQMLIDAKVSEQTSDSSAFVAAVKYDYFSFPVDKANNRLYARLNGNNTRPQISPKSGSFDYATVIWDNTNLIALMFDGTTPPTSGNGYKTFDSPFTPSAETGYGLGSSNNSGQQLVGKIKFFRWYHRVLTEEELAWNRVVDERRFFNRVVPLPVTNAVVATAVAGAEGTEPSGCYAVDVRHAFTAPATVNVGGVDYVCTGYTVETRLGDGWSTPVFHKAALYQPCAFVVSAGDCVRLTWQWAKAAGLKNLGYTVRDYVWDGLSTFYDGICNVGTNLPHSYTATTWVNLGSTGSVNNVFVQRMNAAGNNWETAADLNPVGDRDPGYWTDNGFRIDAEGRFRGNSPAGFAVGSDYSLQMLIEAKASDQMTTSASPFGAHNTNFGIQIRKGSKCLAWRCLGFAATPNLLAPNLPGDTYDYMTAIMHADNRQTFFSGTTEPTSGSGYKTGTSAGYSDTGFCLGGYGKSAVDDLFIGTLKSFRQYGRALSEAEVAQNRKVDNWRYFGIPDETNVIVQSTVPYLRGDEPDGLYAVDVSHVFTAPATVTVKGIDYACDGYIVETWDGSTWVNATSQTGNAYTYTVGSSPALVRLTWKWRATHGLRSAADYSFDDYSQAGLVWNYDGIRNQGGTDADHNSSATTWKNLGSGGSVFDLSFKSGTTTTGEWADDGYIFRDGPRFWSGAHVGPVKSFTLQALVDADIASQPAHTHSYIMSLLTDSFNMSLVSPTYNGSAASSICWYAQGGMMMYFHAKDLHYTYATAMMDFEAKQAMMFPDTTIPTNYVKEGVYGNQRLFHQYTSVSAVEDTGYGLGNANNANESGMNGTIKSFRYYDRVLTEEELVRNRNADSVRYFGELGVTNVLVRTKYGDGTGETLAEAPGAYKVEGSWTFSATSVKDANGMPAPVAGYYTDELVNGTWSNKTWHGGQTEYTYDEATANGKTVRLTWSVPPIGMRVILR